MGRDGLGLGLDPVYWSHALNQGSAKGECQVKMHLVSISTESSQISVYSHQGIWFYFIMPVRWPICITEPWRLE